MSTPYLLKTCECGCNRNFTAARCDRKYFDASCRKRANREQRGEVVSAVTRCACGCGEIAVGRRKLYFSDACKQRAYRKRKEFDELGPDWDWSERPETPRKADKPGLKVTLWVEP